MRKLFPILLTLCLLPALLLPARAAEKEQIEPYVQSMIQCYRYHQEAAMDVIDDQLAQMEAVDPDQAAVWERIMEDWNWVNTDMPVGENVLPDGLPEDGSLCIVVLGYGLNPDGSMQEELVDRLVVALASALKYPNAWIAVTGGQTSPVEGVTEAGQMAAWLQQKGIEKSRIILENQSLSTVANAVNVYKMLNASYPQISSIALVSSDYHITWSGAMFTTVSNYYFGYKAGNPIDLLASAVCATGQTADTMVQQAWGISLITGMPFDEDAPVPTLYEVEKAEEPAAEQTEAAPHMAQQDQPGEPDQEQPQQEKEKRNFLPLILAPALLAAAGYILMPKKPRKKRQRPEWKWED